MAKAKKVKEVKEKEPKEVKPKGASLFDYISWLTDNKRKWEELTLEEQKGFNVYIINRFFSMEPAFTEAINEMQEYTLKLEKGLVWFVYSTILPKSRIYLKYIKAKEIEGAKQKEIDVFIKHFNCTEQIAIEYLLLLRNKKLDEEIENILKIYG